VICSVQFLLDPRQLSRELLIDKSVMRVDPASARLDARIGDDFWLTQSGKFGGQLCHMRS
jgi:hypothetical protein